MYETFYAEKLYPLQDKVLQLIDALATNFYLTGGTALSRYYIRHRYSDDLDFFVNNLPSFQEEVSKVQKELDANFFITVERSGERFRRFSLQEQDVFLKLEFVNDVPFHFGGFRSFGVYKRVDNLLNILSNKITALMD